MSREPLAYRVHRISLVVLVGLVGLCLAVVVVAAAVPLWEQIVAMVEAQWR